MLLDKIAMGWGNRNLKIWNFVDDKKAISWQFSTATNERPIISGGNYTSLLTATKVFSVYVRRSLHRRYLNRTVNINFAFRTARILLQDFQNYDFLACSLIPDGKVRCDVTWDAVGMSGAKSLHFLDFHGAFSFRFSSEDAREGV